MKKVIVFMSLGMALYATSCIDKNDTDTNGGKSSGVATVDNKPETQQDLVHRGEYLVSIMGCNDCHSPKKMTPQGPVPDQDRLLSGYNSTEPLPTFDAKVAQRDKVLLFNNQLTSFYGPWGTTFAANLTPDDTGIANWTLENFKKALKEGKSKGLDGLRMLLPPMPWQSFKNIKDADAEAIFAYLKSLKPVNNRVPNPVPPAAPTAKL